MESYSPSHVTQDVLSEDEDSADLDANIIYGHPHSLHDDRDAVQYTKSETFLNDTSLLRSRFSDDDIDGVEMENDVAIHDLRNKINKSIKYYEQSSRKYSYKSVSHSSSSDRVTSHTSSHRSSHHTSHSTRRSRNKRKSKSCHHSKSRRKHRERSKPYKKLKKSYQKYHKHSHSQSCSQSPKKKKSKDRSSLDDRKSNSSERSQYYENDNLDIEIRIKNDHRKKHYRETEDKDGVLRPKVTSSNKTNLNALPEGQYQSMINFKQSLEEKFQFSVDSIVNGILSTKSSTEIKEMLDIDISKIMAPEKAKTSTPVKGKMNNSKFYEHCIHCGTLFNISSSSGLCQKCYKLQDEISDKLNIPINSVGEDVNNNAAVSRSSKLPVPLPPKFHSPELLPPGPMPPGPIPFFPPLPFLYATPPPPLPFHLPYVPPHIPDRELQKNQMQNLCDAGSLSHTYAHLSQRIKEKGHGVSSTDSYNSKGKPNNKGQSLSNQNSWHIMSDCGKNSAFDSQTSSSRTQTQNIKQPEPCLNSTQKHAHHSFNNVQINSSYGTDRSVLPSIHGHVLLPAVSVPSITEHSLTLPKNKDWVPPRIDRNDQTTAKSVVSRYDPQSFDYHEKLDSSINRLGSEIIVPIKISASQPKSLRNPSDIMKTLVTRLN